MLCVGYSRGCLRHGSRLCGSVTDMLKLGSSGRTTTARRSLALLIVGLFGVACSSASVSGETDT